MEHPSRFPRPSSLVAVRSDRLRIVVAIASVIFIALAAREAWVHGVPGRARTIVSRTGLAPKSSEEVMLLLAAADGLLPRGARVSFIDPAKRGNDWQFFAVATGQLPYHQVVLPTESPQFLIVQHGGPPDDTWQEIRRLPEGAIYARR